MTDSKPYPLWPGPDERSIVEEMLRDSESGQWNECREYVKKVVEWKTKNIPADQRDDIVQEVMVRVDRYLPSFQFRCSLKTWFFNIIQSCITDAYRKFKHTNQHVTSLVAPSEDPEHEDGILIVHAPLTVEDEYSVRDALEKALAALEEYLSTHSHPARNRRILQMVIFEGHSLEEAANVAGCSAAMVSYVVRSAQSYVRKKLGRQEG